MKKVLLFTLLFVVFFSCQKHVLAQISTTENTPKEEALEAIVSKVIEEKQITVMDKKQLYQKLELTVTNGSLLHKKIIVENGIIPLVNEQKYYVDDRVMVSMVKHMDGETVYYISDYIRRGAILSLFFIFVVLTLIVAKWRGFMSLLGMALTFFIIFNFVLPQISAGASPVVIAVLGSFIIIPVSFFLSHGMNKKTIVAICGTVIALIITGILAHIYVEIAHLTGFSSEESGFLQVAKAGSINMKGLLLAGIIIGVLGVLDDITVSQSSIVYQLKESNNKMTRGELFTRAMSVGQDHISSMTNTLILVYTGASLPLLLLFINNPHPISEVLNYEIIADEIVRTLVGSIGLVLSVPITTYIAALVVSKKP
ncbi:MAG: YibE/F family protein [Patescibacteria group bacterium]